MVLTPRRQYREVLTQLKCLKRSSAFETYSLTSENYSRPIFEFWLLEYCGCYTGMIFIHAHLGAVPIKPYSALATGMPMQTFDRETTPDLIRQAQPHWCITKW